MPFVRRRGRRSYNFTPGWDDTVNAIGTPDVWYTFEEASPGPHANSGSDAAVGDLDEFDQQGVYYLTNSVSTDGNASDSGATLSYEGRAFGGTFPTVKIATTTAASETLAALNSGSPSSTGTFAMLFRAEWGTMDDYIAPYLFHSGNTINQCGLRWIFDASDSAHLRWEVWHDNANYIFYTVTNALAGIDFADGNWHLFVVVQNGTEPTFYIDGVAITTPTPAITGSATAASWIDDISSSSGRTSVGGSDYNDISGQFAIDVDEIVYWDGVQASADKITDLWASVDDVDTVNGVREGFYYAFNEITGGPDSTWTPTGDSTNFCRDNGFGANLATGNFKEGSPLFHYDGPTRYCPSMRIEATSYTAGEGWGWTSFDAADWATDTAGTLILHFQVNTANAWNAMAWSIGPDQDDLIDDGTGFVRLLTTNVLQFRIQDSAGAVMDYRFDYTADGTYDLEDGTWHQIIIQQPADGNGIRLWINGTLFDYNDANVTQDPTNKDFWFNNMDPAWSTTEAMGIGCFLGSTGTGQYSVEGYHSLLVIDDYATVFSAAEGTRLADSMGLS